jgi:hypothetical protein
LGRSAYPERFIRSLHAGKSFPVQTTSRPADS